MPRNARQHFPEDYVANLQTAAQTIAEQSKNTLAGLEPMPCAWLKLAPAYPSFCDQAFAYRNQIFAYLIDKVDAAGNSTLDEEAKKRLLAVAHENNLVPCRFPIKEDHTPLEAEWNLRHLETNDTVVPQAVSSDSPVPLSHWEQLEIATQVTAEWLAENRGGDVTATCAIPGADPQIWFHENTGGQAWILVRLPDDPEYNDEEFLKEHPTLKAFNGYECRVKLTPDTDATQVYRGHAATPSTDGPKKVHASGENLFDEEAPLGAPPPCQPEPEEEKEVDGKGCLVFLVAGIAGLLTAAATVVKALC